jgi:hypothetical protein
MLGITQGWLEGGALVTGILDQRLKLQRLYVSGLAIFHNMAIKEGSSGTWQKKEIINILQTCNGKKQSKYFTLASGYRHEL